MQHPLQHRKMPYKTLVLRNSSGEVKYFMAVNKMIKKTQCRRSSSIIANNRFRRQFYYHEKEEDSRRLAKDLDLIVLNPDFYISNFNHIKHLISDFTPNFFLFHSFYQNLLSGILSQLLDSTKADVSAQFKKWLKFCRPQYKTFAFSIQFLIHIGIYYSVSR